jgi:hypothetical protein
MGQLNIRNVPDEVMKRLKRGAVDKGITLREFVLLVFDSSGLVTNQGPEKIRKMTPELAPESQQPAP